MERQPTVGRAADLRVLADLHAQGRSTLVSGPVGVGRSHLLDEVASTLAARGRAVVRLRGTTAGRSVALAPVVHAVGDDVAHDRPGVLRRAIASGAEGEAAVLAIDDVHLLDDVTLSEVVALVHDERVLVVATCPAGATGLARVQDLWRSGEVTRHALAPLDRSASDALVDARLCGPGSVNLHGIAWSTARGLPLVLVEWLDAVRASDGLVAVGDLWDLDGPVAPTAGLRDLVERLLVDVTNPVRDVLRLVALVEPVPAALLAHGPTLTALAELETRGLVRVDPDGDELTVAHPVVAEVLRADMGRLQRRAVLAQVVERAADRDVDLDPVRHAGWLLELDRDPAPTLAAVAAPLALSRLDAPLAERLASMLPDSTNGMLVRGRAVATQGRIAEALDLLHRALDLATDPRDRAEASATIVEISSLVGADTATARAHLDSAVADATDPVLRRELRARSLLLPALDGRFHGALELGEVLDTGSLPPHVEGHALVANTLAQAMTGRIDGIDARLARGAELAGALARDHPAIPMMQGVSHVLALHALLRLDEARALTDARLVEHAVNPLALMPWLAADSAGLLLRGDLANLLRRARQAVHLGGRGDAIGVRTVVAACGAAVAAIMDSGDAPHTSEEVRTWPHGDQPRIQVWLAHADAWELARAGRFDDAATTARDGGAAAVDLDHVVWGAMTLHVAARVGRPDVVVPLLADLRDDHGPLVGLLADHAVAAAAGDGDALAEVASRCEVAGATAIAVDVLADAADAHAVSGAWTASARCAVRAGELAEHCPTYASPALARIRPPLSGRQHATAREAASGRTSREIGAALGISAKTVDNHLREVYRVLGVSGRDELAAVFPPNGEVSPR